MKMKGNFCAWGLWMLSLNIYEAEGFIYMS